ncbi:hypothetical protein ASG73_00085 [Janibacter sp. Soil728]|uniref:hypothetical protein n=1 Tax=Janibacter sp. Soil728 TaxID=1736393 RepID=UPI0006FFA1D9|nr:hypothetical protein [Janibacter sp. Soil728]KRE38812.1 hypothetical protein ASG73_00085 [Janibacter sp. Soil728]
MTRPTRRTTRLLVPVAAVVVAVGLAACGGTDVPPPTSPPSSSTSATDEVTPETLDRPEQQQVDAATAKAALPTLEDMPDDGWAIDISTFGDDPVTYDPAVCADVELDSQEARTFEDQHRKVNEAARFSTPQSHGGLITATYVESFDAPYPTSLLDAAGEHVTDCATYTWTKNASSSTRHVKAISVPALGDRSFGLRLSSGESESYTDRLYVRSGHNLITVMTLSKEETYDGTLMTKYAQDILDKLKKTP